MSNQDFADWFYKLSLDCKVSVYKELFDKDGSPVNADYRYYMEGIADDFLCAIDRLVHNEYKWIFHMMKLYTIWYMEPDRASNVEEVEVSYQIIYFDSEDPYASEWEYEPLAQFCFAFDIDRMNSACVTDIYERMAEKLGECLKRTFEKWSAAMAEYYSSLGGCYSECLKGKWSDTPMDDPEKYFLTHEVVVLK